MRNITMPNIEKPKHTKDKLAEALHEIGLDELAEQAKLGKYDDYLSDSATPQMDLANELAKVGSVEAITLRRRVIEGDFDATIEESDAWANSKEGQEAFQMLTKGRK